MKPASGSNFLLLLVFLLFASCTGKKTPGEAIVKTYVENLIAEQTYSFNADSLRVHREEIFRKNNITPETFSNELKKYQGDPEAWSLFFKRSNELLDSLKRAGKIS